MAKKQRFSDELRQAIQASAESRYAICQATGTDQGNLSRFMGGGSGLSLETIDKLCAHLGLRLVGDKQTETKGK